MNTKKAPIRGLRLFVNISLQDMGMKAKVVIVKITKVNISTSSIHFKVSCPLSGIPTVERYLCGTNIKQIACSVTPVPQQAPRNILVRPQNWLGDREHRIPNQVPRVGKGYQQAAERIREPSLILGKGG